MSKWYGNIGFVDGVNENVPGVHTENITELPYFGDVIKNTRQLQNVNLRNDSINVSNQISIVADPYADVHIHDMRYVVFQGAKWEISNVDVSERPRLLLSLGGLWNGQ